MHIGLVGGRAEAPAYGVKLPFRRYQRHVIACFRQRRALAPTVSRRIVHLMGCDGLTGGIATADSMNLAVENGHGYGTKAHFKRA